MKHSAPSTLGSLARRVLSLLALCLTVLFVASHAAADAEPRSIDAPMVTGQLKLPELPEGFATREAGWLLLEYPRALEHWVDPLIEEAKQFRILARERLGANVLGRVRLRLAEDATQMATLAPIGAPYPKYAVGVAYSRAGLVLLTEAPLHPSAEHDLRAVFRHELAHVALHDALDGRHVPLWFNEGFAIHLARENTFARTRTLWTAAVSGNLIELKELDRRFPSDIVGVPLAYAQSADVVRYLLRQEDQERFSLLIQRVRRGQSFDRALYDAYGMDLYNLEQAWSADVDSRFSLWPILFSGTLIWGGATALIVVAWRRKRKRARVTLDQWAREEAREDARLVLLKELEAARAAAAANTPQASPGAGVRAAEAASSEGESEKASRAVIARDSLVPKVEHDGNWHTLH